MLRLETGPGLESSSAFIVYFDSGDYGRRLMLINVHGNLRSLEPDDFAREVIGLETYCSLGSVYLSLF